MMIEDIVLEKYRRLVEKTHASKAHEWPIFTGRNQLIGVSGMYLVLVFQHTGNPDIMSSDSIIPDRMMYLTGGVTISESNKEAVRSAIRQRLRLTPSDVVLLLRNIRPLPNFVTKDVVFAIPDPSMDSELQSALSQHEFALGLAPVKIFLSHMGDDKGIVREYKQTLQLLGFEPWIDEDAMPAGTSLERGILRGFEDSCAAVFFVTPRFADESYLATEVEYAIQQKRSKGERFSIITLVLSDGTSSKVAVPSLLRPYVWKEPPSQLQGLREILLALPIGVGEVRWER